ncbi:hypothetical protein EJ110_NYTH25412 [Nymphaea thermarum]|nr:hypothetical protein EJ110_NYTH25412 [Nymphaea thermarum]
MGNTNKRKVKEKRGSQDAVAVAPFAVVVVPPPPSLTFLICATVVVACFRAVVFSLSVFFVRLVLRWPDAMLPTVADALGSGSNIKGENVPVHVTSIRLNKDNYLSWSAALEIGITSRDRLPYITGEKPAPAKNDPQWATWTLEDSQVKVWLISSVSADIQPLILRKSTAYEM